MHPRRPPVISICLLLLTASVLSQQAPPPPKPPSPICLEIVMNQATSSWVCAKCNHGYFLSSDNINCSKCNPGCESCSQSANNCESCKTGNYKSVLSGPGPCLPCVDGCKSCTSQNSCTECFPYRFLISSNSVNSCGKCIDGCYKCTSSSGCVDCDALHTLNKENNTVTCKFNGSGVLMIIFLVIGGLICLVCLCWLSCVFCFAKAVGSGLSSSQHPPHNSSSFN